METNAPYNCWHAVGELSWASSPIPIEPGTEVERNGEKFRVLRCEHQGLTSESQEWSLALVKIDIKFVDGMQKLLQHLPE